METLPKRVLWRDCKQCSRPFVQARRRGRPRVTCSDDCSHARGVHGDVRLARGASPGGGVVFTVTSERHSVQGSNVAILADLFGGDYDDDIPNAYQTEAYVKRTLMRSHERERQEAGEAVSTTDLFGLHPARDEGRTCPNVRRVIGQLDAWDWREASSA